MKTIHVFIVFVVVALIQLFIPAQVILNQESILKSGTFYKFKTQPVDPNDPFRGKYIILNYDINEFKTLDSTWQRKEEVYVYLDVDSLGYAKIDEISRMPLLENKKDYIKAEAGWYRKHSQKLRIDFPFNRYYMKETKAYDAEVAVRTRQRDTLPNNTYALVSVKEGEAVLEDVIIDEMSIKDYVEKK